jgi:hypothetical protein
MAYYLGIDWGTHSSKWVVQTDSRSPVIGPIWDSAVCCLDDSLHMFTLDERFDNPAREMALKRKLIQDPDQPFWEGHRPKLGSTLGEAVVFSLLCLLFDAQNALEKKGKTLIHDGPLTLRFSHPNWISEDNIRALSYYRDAVAVAVSIFVQGAQHKIGTRSVSISGNTLRNAVDRHRRVIEGLPAFPSRYDYREYLKCSKGTIKNTNWELVFESCAAGFPYLLEGERETFEDILTKFPAAKRVRKILVVDVGAGSTDAGYMVRTVRPRNSKRIMRPLLIWLPAADALEVAGRWLTDKILADFKQQGRRTTGVEAEEHKIGSQTWFQKPYVKEWTTLIGDHIAEYIRDIRDDICLPKDPMLEVVLTGGSSVVKPLREATLDKITSALRDRKIGEGLSRATKIIDLVRPESLSKSYRTVEVAQLAVALGASDPLLAEMTAEPHGLREVGWALTV